MGWGGEVGGLTHPPQVVELEPRRGQSKGQRVTQAPPDLVLSKMIHVHVRKKELSIRVFVPTCSPLPPQAEEYTMIGQRL